MRVLSNCAVDGSVLTLPPGQLDRKLYEKVNVVLTCMGGKWNKKLKGHLFEEDPTDLLEDCVLSAEVVDRKKELQFFETPNDLVDDMVQAAGIQRGEIVLEPSAGKGRIVNGILRRYGNSVAIIAMEIDQKNHKHLYTEVGNDELCSMTVILGDFLAIPKRSVHRVLMNPPFRRQQDVCHVLHAWDCVLPGGRLVAIMPDGVAFYRTTGLSAKFQEILSKHGNSTLLPEGTFKESGTMVNTRMVVLNKPQ